MLNLPEVTLCLLNGKGEDVGAEVLYGIGRIIRFGEVLHLSPCKPKRAHPGDWVQLPYMSHANAMTIQTKMMGHLLRTGFMLSIENDGFPINPENWSDDFLAWDYIGAPWPQWDVKTGDSRVGNGGCCLRSRKLIDALKWEDFPGRKKHVGGDYWWCRWPSTLKLVADAGCRFAPLDVALRFSFENPIEEFPMWIHEWSFGFHVPTAIYKSRKKQVLTWAYSKLGVQCA